MRTFAMGLVICLLCGADGKGDVVKSDAAQLEGEWTMESAEQGGKSLPEFVIITAKRVSKNGVTKVTVNGDVFMEAKYVVDPKKSPKTVDYDLIGGPNKGTKQLGIYKIDGDKVTFCFGMAGKDRPTEFATKPGDGYTLSVWKRMKK